MLFQQLQQQFKQQQLPQQFKQQQLQQQRQQQQSTDAILELQCITRPTGKELIIMSCG